MKENPYSHLTEEQKKKEQKHSIRSFISVLIHSQKQSPHDQNTSIRPISQPSYYSDLVSDGLLSLGFIILSMKSPFGCASGGVSRELWMKRQYHPLKASDSVPPTEVLEWRKRATLN